MLAVQKPKDDAARCVPNLLPCHVNHNGSVNAVDRYWKPESDSKAGKQTAYFRGRKLEGYTLRIPDGYKGAILQTTDRSLPVQNKHPPVTSFDAEDEEDEDESPPEVKIMEEVAEFEEIVLWGHEAVPQADEDAYRKGMEEWLSFSEAMNSTSDMKGETQ